jgi:hypothetical protein
LQGPLPNMNLDWPVSSVGPTSLDFCTFYRIHIP